MGLSYIQQCWLGSDSLLGAGVAVKSGKFTPPPLETIDPENAGARGDCARAIFFFLTVYLFLLINWFIYEWMKELMRGNIYVWKVVVS